MSADNMPPLPEPRHNFYIGNGKKPQSKYTAFSADQVRAYARAYADAQVLELVEALQGLLSVCYEELDQKRTPEMAAARAAINKATGKQA